MSLNTIPKTDVTYQKQSQKGYKYQIFYFELACYRIYTTSSGPLSFCHATQKGNLGRDNCQCGGALSKAHLPISFPGCTGVAVINLDFQHSGLGLGGGGGEGDCKAVGGLLSGVLVLVYLWHPQAIVPGPLHVWRDTGVTEREGLSSRHVREFGSGAMREMLACGI